MRRRSRARAPRFIVLVSAAILAGAIVTRAQQSPPEAPPLGQVDFPPYAERTLENGLRVFALEHQEQPVVSVQLVIGAGGGNDPEHLPGLATFTTNLLASGTTSRTALEIAESIDMAGGRLSSRAAREAIIVSASVLADSTDLAFELMRDMVLDPAFAGEEIERLRQQTLSSMRADLQDPDFIADAVFNAALYGSHPYAHPADGTPGSIERIRREDIIAFHETWFAPNVSALSIAGAIDPERAFALAERWFGSWERRVVDPPDLSIREPVEGRRIVVVEVPDSVQTEIRIGQTTVRRKDDDYFAVLVASDVLGGPSGRLMESLRVERGLTYGAYQAIVPRKGPGSLYATTETRTEKTLEAIELIFDEVERLQQEQVPDAELDAVKAFLIGSFPLTIETPDDLAGRLAGIEIYDLGSDYLETYRDELGAITAEEVTRAAREYLRTDDVVIVLVGSMRSFEAALEAMGHVRWIPIESLALDSPTLARAPQ